MKNYYEKKDTRSRKNSGRKHTSSIYYFYWIGMSIITSILAASCAYEAPGKAICGAVFLLVGQAMYPRLEEYYGGLGTGAANAAAQITRYADGIIGVGLFFGCAINLMLG